MLEPLSHEHRLEALCARHGIKLASAHHAMRDAEAAVALVRHLLERDLAPESAQLDLETFMRLRTRGDTRPASEPQIRRVFALARVAGLTGPTAAPTGTRSVISSSASPASLSPISSTASKCRTSSTSSSG